MKLPLFFLVTFSLLFSSTMNAQHLEFVNAGISGNNTQDLLDRLPEVIDLGPDWVLLMVGTNDMLNSNKFVSYNDYEENLKTIVNKLQEQGASVILISPPTVDPIYLFERHGEANFKDKPMKKLYAVGLYMEELSKKEGVYMVDVFKEFQNKNIPVHNEDVFLMNQKNSGKRDGVHPTAEGYQLIAEIIAASLEKQQIELDGKVICFGDSITFGMDVLGEGTVEGETYPAFLKRIVMKKKNND